MQAAPVIAHPAAADHSFSSRLAGLIAELANSRGSGGDSDRAVSRFAVEAARTGELSPSSIDASRALLEILADAFAARPEIPPQQIEAIVEPLAWGLLDRAKF